jgi:hypothetical protein
LHHTAGSMGLKTATARPARPTCRDQAQHLGGPISRAVLVISVIK